MKQIEEKIELIELLTLKVTRFKKKSFLKRTLFYLKIKKSNRPEPLKLRLMQKKSVNAKDFFVRLICCEQEKLENSLNCTSK